MIVMVEVVVVVSRTNGVVEEIETPAMLQHPDLHGNQRAGQEDGEKELVRRKKAGDCISMSKLLVNSIAHWFDMML